ncbi:alternate-type signal peptide domain-containing protein [Microbacterium stercoris]|uniref:Alternate-type signal peptide domain-containing protein n=1 Tax=Microbacterium stercoris TaxID=2820289 RepID=A0A939QJ97_9MICO|nr:alternate-type signal peptide domain-containing protein [Microbacterium stercoris]MBO3663934.1 alternate-type signal peptide domain-containing protein [Microbacterium stercoris]
MSVHNPEIVVVTEEKKRRKGALILGGATIALLAGGSTFALWSAGDTFAGGTITAGDLNLVKTADTTFWDVSADRADATATVTGTDGSQLGHALTPTNASTWRIVPGDKVAASFSADVTLEGDNLVARLGVDGLDANALANTGMSYSYEVYQDGELVSDERALPVAADATLLYLSAPGTGQDAGLEDADTTVLPMETNTEDITVVVYGSFFEDKDGDFTYTEGDVTVTERDQVLAADTLAGLSLTLQQVRDTGAQF